MGRTTHNLDAAGRSLGRLAAEAAKFLMGKHRPQYNARTDNGDFVEVENFSKVKFTGDKMRQKLYYRPTTRPGKLRSEKLIDLWKRDPKQVLRKAVWGMLPKNSLRQQMIKRLIIEL